MDYIIEYHKVLIQNNPNQQHDESIDYDKLLIDEDMDISEEMASIIDGLHGSCIQNAVNVPIDSLIKLMEMERQRSEKPKVICYLCEYDIVEDQNSLCYYKCCPENYYHQECIDSYVDKYECWPICEEKKIIRKYKNE